MIGRMSTLQFNQSGVSTILDAQAQVARLQEQIGTGRRIMTPSDDPSASAQLVTLNTELSKTESHQKNIAAATSALSFEEVALDSANNVLLRARELTRNGARPTPYGVLRVTVDAAALCLKAGNAVLLRGGGEGSRLCAEKQPQRLGVGVLLLRKDHAERSLLLSEEALHEPRCCLEL